MWKNHIELKKVYDVLIFSTYWIGCKYISFDGEGGAGFENLLE